MACQYASRSGWRTQSLKNGMSPTARSSASMSGTPSKPVKRPQIGSLVFCSSASDRPEQCARQRERAARIEHAVEIRAGDLHHQRRTARWRRRQLVGQDPLRMSEGRPAPHPQASVEPWLRPQPGERVATIAPLIDQRVVTTTRPVAPTRTLDDRRVSTLGPEATDNGRAERIDDGVRERNPDEDRRRRAGTHGTIDVGYQRHAVTRRHGNGAIDTDRVLGRTDAQGACEKHRRQLVRDPPTDPGGDQQPGRTLRHASAFRISPGRRQRSRSPMVGTEHQDEGCEHPMKDDRNRSSPPALGRIQRHANGVANHHDAQIQRSGREQRRTEATAGDREESVSACQITRDGPIEKNNQ